jgi:molybdopterin-guanine dinucleotide biosynthesis protein A
MPAIDSSTLSRICQAADRSSSQAVLLRDSEGVVYPLCGLYRRDCLPKIRCALDAGQLRVMDVAARLQPAYVDIAFSIPNINTPEQFTAAIHSCESFHGH